MHIPPGSLVRAVAPLLDFRDRPTVSPTDATAHGLGLDRLGFVLHGFRNGGMSCWAMTADDLMLTLGAPGVLSETPSASPRYDSTGAAVDAASTSVAAFAGAPAATPDPADVDRSGRSASSPRRCGGAGHRAGLLGTRVRRGVLHRRLDRIGVRVGAAGRWVPGPGTPTRRWI